MQSAARVVLFLALLFMNAASADPGAANVPTASGQGPGVHSIWLGPPAVDAHGHPGHIHTVASGDTLWAISDSYLGTAWAWPSIWNENTGIANPHRIWPGDRIWISEYEIRRISREEADAMVKAARVGASHDSPLGVSGAGGINGTLRDRSHDAVRPPAADPRRVLDAVGFVSSETLAAAATIVDSPEPRIWLAGGDRVYLGVGEGEVSPGDRLNVFRHVEPIRDLRSRKLLGHHVGILGWVEVVEVEGDSSIAEVRVSVAEMARGDRVIPRQKWPAPISPKPSLADVSGQIVFLPTPRSVMGTADSVYIDRGADDGLEVGGELEIVDGGRAVMDAVRGSAVKTPTRVVGGLVILATQPKSALAIVTHTRRELELGDSVRSFAAEAVAGL